MRTHGSYSKTFSKCHIVNLCLWPVDAVENLIGLFKCPHEKERAGALNEGIHRPAHSVFRRKTILIEMLGASIDDLASESYQLTKS